MEITRRSRGDHEEVTRRSQGDPRPVLMPAPGPAPGPFSTLRQARLLPYMETLKSLRHARLPSSSSSRLSASSHPRRPPPPQGGPSESTSRSCRPRVPLHSSQGTRRANWSPSTTSPPLRRRGGSTSPSAVSASSALHCRPRRRSACLPYMAGTPRVVGTGCRCSCAPWMPQAPGRRGSLPVGEQFRASLSTWRQGLSRVQPRRSLTEAPSLPRARRTARRRPTPPFRISMRRRSGSPPSPSQSSSTKWPRRGARAATDGTGSANFRMTRGAASSPRQHRPRRRCSRCSHRRDPAASFASPPALGGGFGRSGGRHKTNTQRQ